MKSLSSDFSNSLKDTELKRDRRKDDQPHDPLVGEVLDENGSCEKKEPREKRISFVRSSVGRSSCKSTTY